VRMSWDCVHAPCAMGLSGLSHEPIRHARGMEEIML
jgi:hypothetical protein